MFPWRLKFAPAAAAWIAMTLVAAAGPITSQTETPTGDVWITPDAPTPSASHTAQAAPVYRQLPTGDFWPAEDATTRTANIPALPRDALAREGTASGGVK
jgi:hypothetical protein